MKECIKNVAFKLHHTSSICKKNYLDPKLIEFYNNYPDEFIEYFYAPRTKNIDIVIISHLYIHSKNKCQNTYLISINRSNV